MCNEYQLKLPLSDIMAAFARTGEPLSQPQGAPNLEPLASIRIGDRAPVIGVGDDGPALKLMSWSWPGRRASLCSTSDPTIAPFLIRFGA